MKPRSLQLPMVSAAAALALVASAQVAHAGIFDDIFGGFAERGLTKMSNSAVEASANMRDVTNQFGGLVADLYGGDKEKATRARGILNGVLGRDSNAAVPQVGLSVTVTGPANQPMPLRVAMWPAMDTRDEWVTLRVKADGIASLTFRHLNSSIQVPPTPKEVREQLGKRLALLIQETNRKRFACDNLGQLGGQREACATQVQRDHEVELQLIALERPVVNSPLNIATFLIPGGVYGAIIAPEDELNAIAKANGPQAELQAWAHNYSQPDERTPYFAKHANWKFRVSDWLKRCVETNAAGVGKVCYAFVDFGLLSIHEYVRYMEELAKRGKK